MTVVIAIDGPAGAGKGTLARKIASHYDYAFMDTGLLYRAVAYQMRGRGFAPDDVEAGVKVAKSLTPLDFKENDRLREESVGQLASTIAAHEPVRQALLEFQRAFAKSPHCGSDGVVLDGRDIGTVVCPDATYKIFITASIEARTTRRMKELQSKGIDCIYNQVFEEMKARDLRDQTRQVSPLKPSSDAYILDSSDLNAEEVFQKAIEFIDRQNA